MSSFIDSGIWIVLALVLSSKNNFITAELTICMWCVVAVMNG